MRSDANVKVQAASPPRSGMFSQDDFTIDKKAATACCPRGITVLLRIYEDGSATARFGEACSPTGRTLSNHARHETLVRCRKTQHDPEWRRRYRATRPKIERKVAHLIRRKHGGAPMSVGACASPSTSPSWPPP